MVAAVTSLSCSDTVRSEGSGAGRVHPLVQGWVMRCRFLQEAAGEAQGPVCGTTGRPGMRLVPDRLQPHNVVLPN